MSALRRIRQEIFGINQAEMASIADVSQGTVSKWESGLANPSLDEMARIRAVAAERQIAWDDSWFFEIPQEAAQ